MASVHILDGGLSTELERLGAVFEGELWTGRALLNDPAIVERAHRSFVDAGAEIVITSSYQLSRRGFEEVGLTADEADEALRQSVVVARAAVAGSQAKVAASIGPFGAVLHDGSEYRGDYKVSQRELEDFHRERIQVLASAKPDYLAIETIPNLIEARALSVVLGEDVTGAKDIPKWISFTAGTSDSLWTGESIEDAILTIKHIPGLMAVGVNCVDPTLVTGLVAHIKSVTDLPVIVYANRGGTWDSAAGIWLGQEPKALAEWLPTWRDLGVEYIGGCCGTAAPDIALLANALKSSVESPRLE